MEVVVDPTTSHFTSEESEEIVHVNTVKDSAENRPLSNTVVYGLHKIEYWLNNIDIGCTKLNMGFSQLEGGGWVLGRLGQCPKFDLICTLMASFNIICTLISLDSFIAADIFGYHCSVSYLHIYNLFK